MWSVDTRCGASNGDPVRIEAHIATAGINSKVKKKSTEDDDAEATEGLVYKVGSLYAG